MRATSATRSQRIVGIALFAVISLAAIAPIRSYDFFWHLATGRWIAEHHALPATDPFTIGSDHTPNDRWVNDEWLFDVVLRGVQSVDGFEGLSLIRALFLGGIFSFIFARAARRGDPSIALLFTAVAFFAVQQQLDVRPATVAAALLAIAIVSVDAPAAFVLTTILWINIHPSAILAPLIPALRGRWRLALLSTIALLLNPWGWRGVAAPFAVASLAGGGTFVNAEWLPSRVAEFPLLYITMAVAAALFAMTADRRGQLWRIALLAILAVLAVRHVRNQGLYFAALPLLVTPFVARPLARRSQLAIGAAACIVLVAAFVHDRHGGVDPHRFPVQAVARLKAARLRGNIYNPDQFGGYLIWSFYPERRVLTDGRNELHRTYIAEYSRARLDGRAWSALLRKYRIDLAVDEYRPPMTVQNAMTKQRTVLPASLVYWLRRDWALIAYDDAAMVFARRAAFPKELLEGWELRGVVPD
ncbi:MAG: hypothetical protein JWO56_3718 [Acidobacteria bacterium]|nr:hypothetical protein [Acidobacteriota bacterium]